MPWCSFIHSCVHLCIHAFPPSFIHLCISGYHVRSMRFQFNRWAHYCFSNHNHECIIKTWDVSQSYLVALAKKTDPCQGMVREGFTEEVTWWILKNELSGWTGKGKAFQSKRTVYRKAMCWEGPLFVWCTQQRRGDKRTCGWEPGHIGICRKHGNRKPFKEDTWWWCNKICALERSLWLQCRKPVGRKLELILGTQLRCSCRNPVREGGALH